MQLTRKIVRYQRARARGDETRALAILATFRAEDYKTLDRLDSIDDIAREDAQSTEDALEQYALERETSDLCSR